MDGVDYLLEPLTEREVDVLRLLAEGLSNREIAQRLVIAPETVKWYNKQIYSKLNVHSREQAVARSRLAGLLATQPAVSEPADLNHNLPTQITSFVGRQREIAAVKQLLLTSRLLTLRGPPGTGKTRLAVQVARHILDLYQDGVFFFDLAPINDPQLVLSAIAQEFDLKEAQSQPLIDTLIHHLVDKQMLVILDNFEQVIEAASLVSDLLTACPGLKILVTSREPLRVYGEQEYPVPPLAVPDPSRPEPLQKLSQYEAVELFSQRARAVKPDFTLTEGNASSVSEICARLDGLPLAIELAAARSKLLSPENMCVHLVSRLKTLTGGARDLPLRQQTLRAAIDWSYELLDEDEQRLIKRLSVFQGGRTLDAVETICGSDLSLPILDG
jgi:predicted ATPase/DNA-binding CsgD family transcriptional regulator